MIAKTVYNKRSMVQRMRGVPEVEVTYHRENWREWIEFDLDNMYLKDGKDISYMWAYKKVRDRWDRDVSVFVVLPFAYFVIAGHWLFTKWWRLGKICKKKGWIIKLEEGVIHHWFWIRYLKILNHDNK